MSFEIRDFHRFVLFISFYPLIPPHESVSIEYEQLIAHAKIDTLPHLFITSSDLRPFIKVERKSFFRQSIDCSFSSLILFVQ